MNDDCQVPPHIVAGDAIVVSTEDDSYMERLVGVVNSKHLMIKLMLLSISLSIIHCCVCELDCCYFYDPY